MKSLARSPGGPIVRPTHAETRFQKILVSRDGVDDCIRFVRNRSVRPCRDRRTYRCGILVQSQYRAPVLIHFRGYIETPFTDRVANLRTMLSVETAGAEQPVVGNATGRRCDIWLAVRRRCGVVPRVFLPHGACRWGNGSRRRSPIQRRPV